VLCDAYFMAILWAKQGTGHHILVMVQKCGCTGMDIGLNWGGIVDS
jgi:hypothetical protein